MVVKKPKAHVKKAIPNIIKAHIHWLIAGFLGYELCLFIYTSTYPDVDAISFLEGTLIMMEEFGGFTVAVPIFISLYEIFRRRSNEPT